MKYLIFSFALVLFSGNLTFAQDNIYVESDSVSRKLYLIKKTDGGEFYGFILSDDGREILLETKTIGKIYINKSEIKEIKEIAQNDSLEGQIYGEFRESGAFTTRYYFTANALPLKKKENYSMIHLYGPEVHFAVSDKLSLGVMASWIASPIALAVKYSLYSKNKTHVAFGSIVGSSGYLNNARGYGGLHWLTVTKGNRLSNISLSAGYGYIYSGEDQYIGTKYSINNYDLNHPYYFHNYPREAIEQKIYGDNNNYKDRSFFYTKARGAITIGISGITPVGKKASFIFDSMTFFSQPKEIVYSDYPVEVTYKDPDNGIVDPITGNTNYPQVTNTLIIGKGDLQKGTKLNTVILLMPGMRFNRSYNKAIQITLAGFINIQPDGDVVSYPAPMISWLRQF